MLLVVFVLFMNGVCGLRTVAFWEMVAVDGVLNGSLTDGAKYIDLVTASVDGFTVTVLCETYDDVVKAIFLKVA